MAHKRKIIVLMILAAFLISTVFTGLVTGGENEEDTITFNITIDSYKIISDNDVQEIVVENFGHNLISGYPDIPSKIFSIAIPPEAELVEISFVTKDRVVLPERYNIKPVPIPETIGKVDSEKNERDLIIYDNNYDSVYLNNEPYPTKNVEFVRTSHYRKYNLVDVRVTPFTYIPLSEQLIFYPKITVYVNYKYPDKTIPPIEDNLVKIEQNAQRIVANYDEAQSWYPKGTLDTTGLHDFVIITLDSLTSAVTSLANWEQMKGRTVQVVTTSWIDTNYAGYDLAEKIRNFLRDKYPSSEWGIEDVCLVGHRDNLPMRRTWQDQGYGKPETDFYYAELSLPDNQSWDSDGDHRWGESYGDTVDMYAEINVGRIPWSDPTIVTNICDKSVAYEQNEDPTFKKNILLLGAFFWPDTDNAVLMEMKTNPSLNPWMVDWTMTKLYEQQSSYPYDYNLDYNNVQMVWSSGTFGFVNWAGHGSPTACYEYYPSQPFVDTAMCQYLNDDYPAIIFADACSNSDTDNTNIGMKMLEQGGVGFLGATKVAYGYHGWDDPYDGASSSMDYFFTTRVTSGNYTQGAAHQWALSEMYTYGLWYYPKYETFEWGALWGNPNLGMEYYPSSISVNITSVKTGWNFISLPFQLSDLTSSISKNSLRVVSNDGIYNFDWPDAVAAGLIDNNIFGWNRIGQVYIFTDGLEPGHGYWIYANQDCDIWVDNITLVTDNIITIVEPGWNLVGSAYDQSLNKNDIIVNYNDVDYTWADAASNNNPTGSPLIISNFFGWNRITQSYVLSNTLEPGFGYWIYANQHCTLILPPTS
jgi:hypothetical protein